MNIQKIKKNVIIELLLKVVKDVYLKLYADCNILNQKIWQMIKKFFEQMSITKLVFLIVMICLCVFTWYQIFTWKEIKNWLWENVVLMVVSFYFGQKVWEVEKDPLLDKTKADDKD